MTRHLDVNEDFVASIVENAAWGPLGDVTIEKEVVEEATEETIEEDTEETADEAIEEEEEGGKCKSCGKPSAKLDPNSHTCAGCDSDHERDEKMRQSAESVEEHECPLCESKLDEALTDEQIMEHVASIQDALNTIEESGKEPTDAELDAIEAEDDDDVEEGMSWDDARSDAEDMKAQHKADEDPRDEKGDKIELKKKKASRKEAVMSKVKELKKAATGK